MFCIRELRAMLLSKYCCSFTFLCAVTLIAGCDFLSSGNGCTDEIHLNVCVAGTYEGRESVVFVRETRSAAADTSQGDRAVCFPETALEQRILVVEAGAVIDSSAWFIQASQRACGREPVRITFE